MNRAQAEQEVRSIRRTCRGLPVLSDDVRIKLHTRWQEVEGKNWDAALQVLTDARTAVTIAAQLRKPFGEGAPVPDSWGTLWPEVSGALFAHGDNVGKPCGADFNDVICAEPFDGGEHFGICPKCGNRVAFTSPIFELDS